MLQSVDLINKAIKESRSFREAAKKLGKNDGHSWLKTQAAKFEIDVSHFYSNDIKFLIGQKFNMLTVISVKRSGESVDKKRQRSFALC